MKKNNFNQLTLIVSLLCLSIAVLMVFGSSLEFWEPIVGFKASNNYNDLLGYITVIFVLCSVVINIKKKQAFITYQTFTALFVGIMILSPGLINTFKKPIKFPPIHDITTDTNNPPQFLFLTDNRQGAVNSLQYEGEKVAKQQLMFFPFIKPIITELKPIDAYNKALKIGKDMGWELVNEEAKNLHYEATARTPFFNFADDIVVEVTPQKNGSLVNLRSVSRIGRGDRGVNGKRVKEFIQRYFE